MDSEKLQKLANIAIVRQHAATVIASTNFNRKYIIKVNAVIGALDTEFVNVLVETIGDTGEQDALTISQRLAEEKAKIKTKLEPAKIIDNTDVKDLLEPTSVLEDEISVTVKPKQTRPTIKTAKTPK